MYPVPPGWALGFKIPKLHVFFFTKSPFRIGTSSKKIKHVTLEHKKTTSNIKEQFGIPIGIPSIQTYIKNNDNQTNTTNSSHVFKRVEFQPVFFSTSVSSNGQAMQLGHGKLRLSFAHPGPFGRPSWRGSDCFKKENDTDLQNKLMWIQILVLKVLFSPVFCQISTG